LGGGGLEGGAHGGMDWALAVPRGSAVRPHGLLRGLWRGRRGFGGLEAGAGGFSSGVRGPRGRVRGAPSGVRGRCAGPEVRCSGSGCRARGPRGRVRELPCSGSGGVFVRGFGGLEAGALVRGPAGFRGSGGPWSSPVQDGAAGCVGFVGLEARAQLLVQGGFRGLEGPGVFGGLRAVL